jgi:predicted nucleic acid-binding protein
MPDGWVINASPLIVLSKINQQHLLWQLATELVVPESVLAEINAGPANDPARQYLAEASLTFVPVAPEPLITAWDLGAGESAVLAHALAHPGWKAVIDDGAARRCARVLAIPFIGTLGIIIRARQSGLIPQAIPLLKEIKNHGFHLDDEVIRIALQETLGESWS